MTSLAQKTGNGKLVAFVSSIITISSSHSNFCVTAGGISHSVGYSALYSLWYKTKRFFLPDPSQSGWSLVRSVHTRSCFKLNLQKRVKTWKYSLSIQVQLKLLNLPETETYYLVVLFTYKQALSFTISNNNAFGDMYCVTISTAKIGKRENYQGKVSRLGLCLLKTALALYLQNK